MTNVIDFPPAQTADIINESIFAKVADAALLLMVFESIADAVEVIEEGSKIRDRDETHVSLIEACMALAVMFRRRTGHDVQSVSADHLAHQKQCLMNGVEIESLPIPVRRAAFNPLPAAAFKAIPTAELARIAFNYASRSHEHIEGNCPHLVELDLARSHSLDAMSALVVLIERLAGSVASITGSDIAKVNAPGSETLQ
jgi:hypothetical protein